MPRRLLHGRSFCADSSHFYRYGQAYPTSFFGHHDLRCHIQVGLKVLDPIVDYIGRKLKEYEERYQTKTGQEEDEEEGGEKDNDDSEKQQFDKEIDREEFEDTIEEMAQVVNLYGLVTCFVTVFPAGPLVALILNLYEIRSDAHKMMVENRRPIPELVQDIGMWQSLLDMLGVACILCNTGLIVFTTNTFKAYALETKWLIFLLAEITQMVARNFLQYITPDEPGDLNDIKARHKFLVKKHIHGFVEDEDDDDDEGMTKVTRHILLRMLGLLQTWTSILFLFLYQGPRSRRPRGYGSLQAG